MESFDTMKEIKNNFSESNKLKEKFDSRAEVGKKGDLKEAKKFDPDARIEKPMGKLVADYEKEVKNFASCPETLKNFKLDASDFVKVDPEKVKELRHDFNENKAKLISQWETANGREWPRYTEDISVKLQNGKDVVIRRAGERHDCHHDLPLSMGGKNEVSNITPVRADVHFDHRGIHRHDGPYEQLENRLGNN